MIVGDATVCPPCPPCNDGGEVCCDLYVVLIIHGTAVAGTYNLRINGGDNIGFSDSASGDPRVYILSTEDIGEPGDPGSFCGSIYADLVTTYGGSSVVYVPAGLDDIPRPFTPAIPCYDGRTGFQLELPDSDPPPEIDYLVYRNCNGAGCSLILSGTWPEDSDQPDEFSPNMDVSPYLSHVYWGCCDCSSAGFEPIDPDVPEVLIPSPAAQATCFFAQHLVDLRNFRPDCTSPVPTVPNGSTTNSTDGVLVAINCSTGDMEARCVATEFSADFCTYPGYPDPNGNAGVLYSGDDNKAPTFTVDLAPPGGKKIRFVSFPVAVNGFGNTSWTASMTSTAGSLSDTGLVTTSTFVPFSETQGGGMFYAPPGHTISQVVMQCNDNIEAAMGNLLLCMDESEEE